MKDTTKNEEALKGLKARRAILQRDIDLMERMLKKNRSQNFIEANDISFSDVEMSSGDDKPYFGSARKFGFWLRNNKCSKRFAEWNGRLHYTSELIVGIYKPTPGRVEYIPS